MLLNLKKENYGYSKKDFLKISSFEKNILKKFLLIISIH